MAAGPLTLLEELRDNVKAGKLNDPRFMEMTSRGWGHTPGVDYIFGRAGSDIAHAIIGYNIHHTEPEKVVEAVQANIDRAIKENQPFKGLSGEQQETRDTWRRLMNKWKKLKYRDDVEISAAMKTAGRSSLIPFLFYPKFVYGAPGGSKSWAWRTTGGAGRATPQNIERYVENYNKHLEPGGVNEHLGRRDAIYGGSVVNQKTGETVADWEDRGIIQFYKNKPMFEVVGRELVKVAKRLMAEQDFPPEWEEGYRLGGRLAAKLDWNINDVVMAAKTIAEGSVYRDLQAKCAEWLVKAGVDTANIKDEDFDMDVVKLVKEARDYARKALMKALRVGDGKMARFGLLGLIAGVLEESNVHELAGLVYDIAEKELKG
jgi:hypothetical protein